MCLVQCNRNTNSYSFWISTLELSKAVVRWNSKVWLCSAWPVPASPLIQPWLLIFGVEEEGRRRRKGSNSVIYLALFWYYPFLNLMDCLISCSHFSFENDPLRNSPISVDWSAMVFLIRQMYLCFSRFFISFSVVMHTLSNLSFFSAEIFFFFSLGGCLGSIQHNPTPTLSSN